MKDEDVDNDCGNRDVGVTHDLSPVGDTTGNFQDQDGHPAYRQNGLGDQGLTMTRPIVK